jgi:hypothetical protein
VAGRRLINSHASLILPLSLTYLLLLLLLQ